ncbi:MAG: hypothetical protein LBM87_07040 [Ruminococcus sp.]|jgi:hypothetical protein|nr:hypothetical protein [Ruminococcus sp.]
MKSKIYWIAKTAVFIALLITLQAVTKPAGQFVTGSCVNLMLILSVMTGGIASGTTVALVSPLMAFLLQIAPMPMPLPLFVAVGNISLVLVWFLIGKIKLPNKIVNNIISTIIGAAVKFGVLYAVMVRFAIPMWANEKQAVVMTAQMGIPQLITALIGGAVAVIVLPALLKATQAIEKKTA